MNNCELCSNEHSKYFFEFFKGNLTPHVAAILELYIHFSNFSRSFLGVIN